MDNLDFNYFCRDCKRSREYREANCFTNFRIRKYNRGDYIAFKGERVKELSIVVEGSINVSFVLDSGLIIRSVNHTSPVPIGGVALFSKENRYLVDTKAIEPCTIISVSREDILQQIKECEDLMVSIIDYSASRVDRLSSHLAALTQRTLRSKVAHYILTHSQNGEYTFARSIEDLAHYLCVERPSLSRTISELKREGIISYSRGRGKIIDEVALKNILI